MRVKKKLIIRSKQDSVYGYIIDITKVYNSCNTIWSDDLLITYEHKLSLLDDYDFVTDIFYTIKSKKK